MLSFWKNLFEHLAEAQRFGKAIQHGDTEHTEFRGVGSRPQTKAGKCLCETPSSAWPKAARAGRGSVLKYFRTVVRAAQGPSRAGSFEYLILDNGQSQCSKRLLLSDRLEVFSSIFQVAFELLGE